MLIISIWHEIKLIVKQILCIKLVKYWDKYTEMHGQQKSVIISSKFINKAYLLFALEYFHLYRCIIFCLQSGMSCYLKLRYLAIVLIGIEIT